MISTRSTANWSRTSIRERFDKSKKQTIREKANSAKRVRLFYALTRGRKGLSLLVLAVICDGFGIFLRLCARRRRGIFRGFFRCGVGVDGLAEDEEALE